MVSVSKSGMSSRATVTSRRMSVPPVRMVSGGGSDHSDDGDDGDDGGDSRSGVRAALKGMMRSSRRQRITVSVGVVVGMEV